MKAHAVRIRPALASPPPDIRLFLLYGPDEAGARDLATVLAKAMGPDAERVDLTPATLRTQPGLLADEAASLSLFGGARHIRVAGGGEEVLEAATLLLGAELTGSPVVVLAPALKATAKLVKRALDSPRALVLACHEPSAAEIDRIASELGRAQGLQFERGIARRIAEAAGGDRAVMAREVEKLALYLDAAPDRPRPLDDDALDAVGADLVDADADAFAAAVVAGRVSDAGELLAGLAESGQSAIPWLRALARRLTLLAELRREAGAGGDLSGAFKRFRVHFTQQAEVGAAVSRWSPNRIASALDAVRAVERAVIASGSAGDVLARAATLDLARRAAPR